MIHDTAHTHDVYSPQRRKRKRRLTVETALWLIVLALALSLRLFQLDRAPLSIPEAREATLAWRAASGQGLPQHDDYSPLLFTLNTATFTLRGGATDSLARWWPALAGALLALTPALLREHIGRVGALVTGLYLAISPACLVASRQVDGAIFAALGGMICLGGLYRTVSATHASDNRWLYLSALGLALAVTGSSLLYGIMLPLGIAVGGGMYLLVERAGDEQDKDLADAFHPRNLYPQIRSHWLRFAIVASVLALAFSTMLGVNPGGLGATGGLLADWLAGFQARESTMPPLTLLLIYEPVALLFGLGGIGVVLWRQHRFGIVLGMWVVFSSFLLALAPGRAPLAMLGIVLPLSLLVGITCEQLIQTFLRESHWVNEGIHAPVVVILWIHCGLMLARYTVSGTLSDLALVLLTVALQIMLAAMFAITMDVGAAVRALLMGTGFVALGVTFAAGWGVAHVRPADPREPLLHAPTDLGMHALVETLRERSWRETGLPNTLPIAYQANLDSPLAWYLRALDSGFSQARLIDDSRERADTPGERPSTDRLFSTIVTAERDPSALAEILNLPYDTLGDTDDSTTPIVGQDFVLHRRWDPKIVDWTWAWPPPDRLYPQFRDLVKWWMFRETDTPPPVEETLVLWVLEDAVWLR
ncbi:MAG TPA: hypothetical protein ENN19_00530 [Chloroflexi bacterium]|nr:hypothetical protein [Chloroflexota bacterium]